MYTALLLYFMGNATSLYCLQLRVPALNFEKLKIITLNLFSNPFQANILSFRSAFEIKNEDLFCQIQQF